MMKKFITCLSLLLITSAGFAQQNEKADRKEGGIDFSNLQRTPKLDQLYQDAKVLNISGTPEQINANRLALKEAWEEVSPEIAARYNNDSFIELTHGHGRNTIAEGNTSNRPENTPNTVQAFDGFADYMDMKIAANGDIYIASAPWDEKSITIRRSTDNGNTWSTFEVVSPQVKITKLQMQLLTGVGQEFLNVYYKGADNKLHLFTTNISQGGHSNGTYSSIGEIKDFSTTKSTEPSTGLQRVFIVYVKVNDELFGARTAPGNYGINFIDPYDLSVLGEQVHLSYGHGGSLYLTYIGKDSRKIYAEVHPNFLDPGTSTSFANLGDEITMEFKNPVIAASRKALANDNVIIAVSQRFKNTSDPFRQVIFNRKNEGPWSSIYESPYIPTYSLESPKVFVRNEDGNEIIRTSYLKFNSVSQSSEGEGYSQTYDGTSMGTPEIFTDSQMEIYNPIIGETSDGQVCMAYIQEYQSYGYGIFFTSTNVLSTGDQTITGLSVYPVPAQETVTISAPRPIDRVKVSSVLGQKVMEVSNNTNEITLNTSAFAKGVYFLEIHSEGRSEIRKIIKN